MKWHAILAIVVVFCDITIGIKNGSPTQGFTYVEADKLDLNDPNINSQLQLVLSTLGKQNQDVQVAVVPVEAKPRQKFGNYQIDYIDVYEVDAKTDKNKFPNPNMRYPYYNNNNPQHSRPPPPPPPPGFEENVKNSNDYNNDYQNHDDYPPPPPPRRHRYPRPPPPPPEDDDDDEDYPPPPPPRGPRDRGPPYGRGNPHHHGPPPGHGPPHGHPHGGPPGHRRPPPPPPPDDYDRFDEDDWHSHPPNHHHRPHYGQQDQDPEDKPPIFADGPFKGSNIDHFIDGKFPVILLKENEIRK